MDLIDITEYVIQQVHNTHSPQQAKECFPNYIIS
jgi:hypothetical protein